MQINTADFLRREKLLQLISRHAHCLFLLLSILSSPILSIGLETKSANGFSTELHIFQMMVEYAYHRIYLIKLLKPYLP